MSKTVGVIGLGIMGGPIAKNIRAKGFNVIGYNRSDKSAWAKSADVKLAASPRELAEAAEVIITMVNDHKAVRSVALDANGFLSANVKGKTWLQMSTVDGKSTLAFADEAAKRGMNYLDCPVTGSKKQVEEGQLIILAGGDEQVVNDCRDVFMATSKAIVQAGGIGKGTLLKLSMNLAVVQMTTAICEAVAFAKNLGVEPEKIFEVIGHSPALNCGYYQIKKKPLLEGDFTPAFSVANMLKDVRYIDEAAKAARIPLPVTQAVRFILEAAVTEGLGAEDLTSIVKILRPRSKAAV
jgi:3-hydroxyisobutyrate dehydrogenase-like beta-hydroxyacid dehydrogenase